MGSRTRPRVGARPSARRARWLSTGSRSYSRRWNRGRARALENQLAFSSIDADVVAVVKLPAQKTHRQGLNDLLLNRPSQGSRPVDRVETFARYQLFGRFGELDRHIALLQTLPQ